jgi:hypothetical protein
MNSGMGERAPTRTVALEAGTRLKEAFRILGISFELVPGTVATYCVPGFLQRLELDPAELETLLLKTARHAYKDEPLDDQPDKPVHVHGTHRALHYRGKPIPRSKQWFQHGGSDHLKYLYTGWQWLIANAQRPTSVVPVIERLVDQINNRLELRMNHVIFTQYKSGADCIGWHSDKPKTLGSQPDDFILVVKTGSQGRPFCVGQPRGDVWTETLAPGTLLIMSLYDNNIVQHCVPRVPDAGPTSSLVLRHVSLKVPTATVQKETLRRLRVDTTTGPHKKTKQI